ncbi:hypothetical protein ATEG_01252 [Aspergillus terreus NIH2624]|uniref:LIM-domain binding protein-domain-containing protein n=1 Tax=Aspergillus terreus (strain NIH 2624 / FGSC A1156) TaxID=341663 RepID=Q0CYI2_ASPTN|nr:uncharacterized protein ATEG_01252 [Aspergillus terreus NIH2624]EAU38009.1 hypothetical protein ATEG_01252 [Aspergillus terreus NIH2624]
MAQPYPAHQGIPQHPGLPPGHPMAPGQHPNAHPGAGMVQPVHPGALVPATAFRPELVSTELVANNPQLLQHHQQQQLLRQRMLFQQQQHQQQQQQQQQQQHGGLPVSLPNGTQGLTSAQIAAMQGNPGMRPMNLQMHLQQMPHGQPQNIQQQQQHFIAMQQAQQAQAHQAQQVQQAGNAGQPGQQTPQQRPAPQPQNVHDAQSVTPQPQPGPQPHQGSATPQPNPPQPPSSQPPQQQQQQPVSQPQPTPNPPPQALPQSQQQVPQQQTPQQPQSQPPPQQGQQGQPQGPQQQQMTAQEAQLKAQQQQQQNNAAMLMQQRMNMKGASILCLNTFAENLSAFSNRRTDDQNNHRVNEASDLQYWQNFVDRFYSPSGVLRQGVYNPSAGSKQFEIATPALARWYLTQFNSGISRIQMFLEGARERDSHNGGHIVEVTRCTFIYYFTNETQLVSHGALRAHFDMHNKIEMLDIVIMNHTEYLPRSKVLEAADQKQSPKVSKNTGKRAQQKQAPQPSLTLPESMVTANGVPTAVMSFLEVAETISQMQMLFQFSQQNPQLAPPDALRNLVNTLQTQNPNPGFMPAPMNPAMQQGQNPRGPNMNGPNQFASPAMGHLGLPVGHGSPHPGTGSAQPSPAQSQIVAPPGMMPPGQVQPNVGQGHSASASPNVSNKRRRASTVKTEMDEGGGPEVNGAVGQGPKTVKQSPRVGKKQKPSA